jgi:hypothetical protein
MADGGIGEAALLDAALEGAGTGAAIGGGMSLLTGQDPLKGALMGGLTGGAFGGAGAAFSDVPAGVDAFTAQTSTGLPTVATDASNSTQALTGLQEPPVYSPSTNYQDFGPSNPLASQSTNGIVGYQGGENVLQNQLGATVGGAPVNPMYTDVAPATGLGAPGSTQTISPIAGATGAGATPAATSTGGIGNLVDKAGNFISEHPYMTAGGLGLAYLMNQERNKYGVPAAEKYTGPLSKFSYNPNTYQPDVVRPPNPVYRAQYAGGGPVEMMSNNAAIGANTMYPMANMTTSAFATPYQDPRATNMMSAMAPSGGGTVDAMSGEPSMQGTRMASGGSVRHYDIGGEIGGAFNSIGNGIGGALGGVNNLITNAGQGRISLADQPGTMSFDDPRFKAHLEAMLQGKQPPQYASGGGISSLGSYSDGGRMLKGPGDGMSDSIPAKIGERQPARLADSEFVVPADVVSHLGNGSSDAGAKQLYKMMDRVRKARTGTEKQGRQIQPSKYIPA